MIEDAKTDGVIAKAKALRRALDNSPNNDLIDEDGFWESTKAGIIEDAIEDIILGGRDIESIDDHPIGDDDNIIFIPYGIR